MGEGANVLRRMKLAVGSRIAIVTGAGSGIGRSIALILAREGYHLLVNDISPDACGRVVNEIRDDGGQATELPADVSDFRMVGDAIQDAEARLGPTNVLVNNAGISGRRAPFETIDDDLLDRMLAVHVKGAFNTTRAVIASMKARHSGAIVNVSSVGGMTGFPYSSHYCAAKAALLGMTKTWAKEFAPWNIRVNAVAPGIIDTPMLANVDAAFLFRAWGPPMTWAKPSCSWRRPRRHTSRAKSLA
jgi:3-oxoacyl-[acyl-carrier protein] reductase